MQCILPGARETLMDNRDMGPGGDDHTHTHGYLQAGGALWRARVGAGAVRVMWARLS